MGTLTAFCAFVAASGAAMAAISPAPGGGTAGPDPPPLTSGRVPLPSAVNGVLADRLTSGALNDRPSWSSHSKPGPVSIDLSPRR